MKKIFIEDLLYCDCCCGVTSEDEAFIIYANSKKTEYINLCPKCTDMHLSSYAEKCDECDEYYSNELMTTVEEIDKYTKRNKIICINCLQEGEWN